MADESTSYSDLISRRRFVELTGVTGAAALAGCDGDGDGTDTPSGNGNGTDEETQTFTDSTPTEAENWYPDAEHVSVETTDPGQVQFNPFNSSGSPAVADRLLFEKMAQYSYARGKFIPAGLESWNLDGTTLTLNLKEGITWSNGDPMTAEDIKLHLQLAEFDEDPIWEWTNEITVVDDQTLELSVSDSVNKVVMEADLFTGRMMKIDRATYSDWLDDLQNNDATVKDLRGFTDDDPNTNGPFTFASADAEQLKCEHIKKAGSGDNPWAKNINFGNYTWTAGGNNTQRLNALRSLEVDSDFSLAVPARAMAGFPDSIEEANYYDVWGYGIFPNHNHKHAGDRAVRQAIAYAINRVQCVNNSLPRAKEAVDYAVGISDAGGNQSNWLGDRADEYETYGKDKVMGDKVTEVMEDAGYAKDGGTWTDQDGNTVSLPITFPSGWGDWQAQAQTIKQNLESVGFESSLDGSAGFYTDGNPMKQGDFVLASAPWLHGGPLTHPYFSFQHQFIDPQIPSQEAKANYPSWTEQWGGSKASIEVPTRDGSGTKEVDVRSLVQEMSSTRDDDTITENIHELAWVSNVDLPSIPIVDKVLQQWLTSDDWTVPENAETEHSSVQFACTWMPRQGLMNWKGN